MTAYREDLKHISTALLVTAREVAKDDPEEAALLFGLQPSEVRLLVATDLPALLGAYEGELMPFRPRHVLRSMLNGSAVEAARSMSRELSWVSAND